MYGNVCKKMSVQPFSLFAKKLRGASRPPPPRRGFRRVIRCSAVLMLGTSMSTCRLRARTVRIRSLPLHHPFLVAPAGNFPSLPMTGPGGAVPARQLDKPARSYFYRVPAGMTRISAGEAGGGGPGPPPDRINVNSWGDRGTRKKYKNRPF